MVNRLSWSTTRTLPVASLLIAITRVMRMSFEAWVEWSHSEFLISDGFRGGAGLQEGFCAVWEPRRAADHK